MQLTQEELNELNIKIMLFCNNLRFFLDKKDPVHATMMSEEQRNFMAAAAIISECYRNETIKNILIENRIMPNEEEMNRMFAEHKTKVKEQADKDAGIEPEAETVQ